MTVVSAMKSSKCKKEHPHLKKWSSHDVLQGNALEWQKKKKKGFEMYAYIAST